CRARRRHIASSSTARRRNSASRNTPTWRTGPAGSATAPRVTSRRAAPRSSRTPAGRRICRRATGSSRFPPWRRRPPGSIASTPATIATRARRSTSHTRISTPASCYRGFWESRAHDTNHGTESPVRIAHIAPVATTIPPPKSGSVETMTSLLTEGLAARGHDVTLFATGDSKTRAKLVGIYPHGYWHDENMWPWELYEMLNLAAAVERAGEFDIIHYEAAYYPMSLAFTRLSPTPIVQTLHHSPGAAEVALWSRYPEAPFVAISQEQATLLSGANVVATVLHGIDTDNFTFGEKPEDYLLFHVRFPQGTRV